MLKTTRVSDLSGSDKEVEEVTFALAGQSYALDLTDKERAEFLKAFERYTSCATPVSATTSSRGAEKAKAEKIGPTQAQLMREWAKANGVPLPAKGVVPKEVRELYRAATAKDTDAAPTQQETVAKVEVRRRP